MKLRKLSIKSYKVKEENKRNPKKVIREEELERYLAEGWDVQAILPSGRNTY